MAQDTTQPLSAAAIEGSVDADVVTGQQAPTNEGAAAPVVESNETPRKRKDSGHLHATRHAVMSRYPLEALRHVGVDVKQFRRLERRLRAALKPRGEIAGIFFDRFFSSYLRCVLAARLEASAFEPKAAGPPRTTSLPTLQERDLPTLLYPEEHDRQLIGAVLPPDLFRELALVQRYDGHFSKEMFRALSVLLVLRSNGETGLERCIGQMVGARKDSTEG